MKKITSLFLLFFLTMPYLYANDPVNLFSPKQATPKRKFSSLVSKPDIFVSSNNLAKKPGSFYGAKGEVIYLTGQVTDSFGVPVSGAVIRIWQTNSAGWYQNLLVADSDLIDENFSMSGKTATDNLGNFGFITIMPGSYANRAPHINIDVAHRQFESLESEIYFADHPKNDQDYQYLSYDDLQKKLLTANVRLANGLDPSSTKIFNFDVTLEGVHKFKGFNISTQKNPQI